MLRRWTLEHFKSVREKSELELGAITILAGANSTGKSSIIQSILMISQTTSSRLGSRSIVLNGGLVKLGTFDDLLSRGVEDRKISVSWECAPGLQDALLPDDEEDDLFYEEGDLESVVCELTFTEGPTSVQPVLVTSTLQGVARDDDGKVLRQHYRVDRVDNIDLRLEELGLAPDTTRRTRSWLEFKATADEFDRRGLQRDLSSATLVGSMVSHYLPRGSVLRLDDSERKAVYLASALIREQRGSHFWSPTYYGFGDDLEIPGEVMNKLLFELGPEAGKYFSNLQTSLSNSGDEEGTVRLGDIVRAQNQVRHSLNREQLGTLVVDLQDAYGQVVQAAREAWGERLMLEWVPLPDVVELGVNYVEHFFGARVKYLGPLRDDPRPLYPLPASGDPTDVGLRGEYTAATYDLNKQREVTYVSTDGFLGESGLSTKTAPLSIAVAEWLQYLEIASGIQTTDRGKLGHEMTVTPLGSKTKHDLTHVGVGVSQVLPILVMSLLAEPDTLLLYEQPEIHLHPKVQSRLADFFIALAHSGKQCLVETHSDHLVSQFRFRAAEWRDDTPIPELLRMYFVELENGTSSYRRVGLNEYGAIQDWPQGFLDEAHQQADRILAAAARRRRHVNGE